MNKIGLFPGSFDPFTRGHQAIVEESLRIFDKVIIAIGYNTAKRGMLTAEARKALIERVYENNPRVEVTTYTSLTGDEARRMGATTMIRSIRNATDFEYERNLDRINRELYPDLHTIFIIAPTEVEHISSSLVRELHSFNHDTKSLLPKGIVLEEYLTHENK